MKEALCRPDEFHWCIECCRQTCPLLGDTDDGKMGCLGHHGKRTIDGLIQTSFCQEIDCLTDKSSREREEIRRIIAELPPGQFKISEVLRHKSNKPLGDKNPNGFLFF
jgi:hypothetical protein